MSESLNLFGLAVNLLSVGHENSSLHSPASPRFSLRTDERFRIKGSGTFSEQAVGQTSLTACQPHTHAYPPGFWETLVTYCASSCGQVPHRVHSLENCFSLLAMSDLTPQDGANQFNSNCQLRFTSKQSTLERHKLWNTIIGMVHVWKVGQRHLNIFKTETLAEWRNKGKVG